MTKPWMIALSFVSLGIAAAATPAEEINQLLRGELSAVETYQRALEKLGDDPGAKTLEGALKNHQDAVVKLTEEVKKLKAEPSTDSGAWGTLTATVVQSAKLLGDKAALSALKQGEEHGVKEYQEALQERSVPKGVKKLIREKLLKRQQEHVNQIAMMIEKM